MTMGGAMVMTMKSIP